MFVIIYDKFNGANYWDQYQMLEANVLYLDKLKDKVVTICI